MRGRARPAADEVLDRCIDDLLRGRQWVVGLPAGDEKEEVTQLMQIAQLLLLAAPSPDRSCPS